MATDHPVLRLTSKDSANIPITHAREQITSEYQTMTLKHKTFSAVRWTTIAMLGKAVLMLLQIGLLARLLTPIDFGLMALATAVIAFAQIFSDMGISNAIIHHQNISQEALSSLYWLNVVASTLLMLLLMLLSPFIAAWYQEPRMQTVLILVSLSFLIGALGQQLRVLAEKNLRFQPLAIIELTASLLGFVVSLSIAFAGGGVFALVAGMLTGALVASLLCWLMLADGWRPLWRLRLGEIKGFLGFGAYMVGFSLTNTVNLQADILIGGRVLGTSSLGAYSLPKDLSLRLAMIINPIVTRVGMPVMAQAQGDKTLLKSIYLKTLRMTASVNFPLYLMIAIFAPEIVAIMFGAQWQASVPLLRILALWGMVRSTANPSGSLIFAMGRANLAFWWSLGLMLFLAPAYWIGSQYGIKGLALSMLISMLAIPLPQWFITIRPLCGAGFSEYFKQLAIPFVISALAAAAGFAFATLFETVLLHLSEGVMVEGFIIERFIVGGLMHAVLRLGTGLAVGGLVYLMLSRWLNRTWFAAITELLLGRVWSAKLLAKTNI